MKKFLLLFWLAALPAIAQDNQDQSALKKTDVLLECVQLKENGFLLKFGNGGFLGKRDNTLRYYTAQGKLMWETKIENQYQALKSENFVVAAPDGSVVYDIELMNGRFEGQKMLLTQINGKGSAKKLALEVNKDYGQHLQSVFCDEQYLYLLTTENGDELSNKKKGSEKLIFNRLTHAGLSRKKFVLSLPAITEPENTSFWSFAGQYKGEKYLLSKKINTDIGKQVYDLVTIDQEGKVLKKVTIDQSMPGKYVRPAVSLALNEGKSINSGSRNLADLNFERGTSTFTTPSTAHMAGHTYTNQSGKVHSAAFGYLTVNPADQAIYIYGLLGPKPFQRVNPGYEGFYVSKYDLSGRELWQLIEPAPKELQEAKFYTTHGLPWDRSIAFTLFPDGHMSFSLSYGKNLSAKKSLFVFNISDAGKVTNVHSQSEAGEVPVPVRSPGAVSFVKKEVAANAPTVAFPTTDGEIVVVADEKRLKLNVLYFKL